MIVTLGVVGAIAAAWMVSRDDEPTHEAVCMEAATELRVDEAECDNGGSGGRFHYIYYPISARTSHPPIGSKVASGFTSSPPAGGYRVGNVPARGGFGGRGGSFVGG